MLEIAILVLNILALCGVVTSIKSLAIAVLACLGVKIICEILVEVKKRR